MFIDLSGPEVKYLKTFLQDDKFNNYVGQETRNSVLQKLWDIEDYNDK